MVDVFVNTDDLTVLGGPSNIDVSVSYGERGARGSLILYGYGSPESQTSFIETPQVYDLYINLRTSDADNGWVYQYITDIQGDNIWTPVVQMQPGIYNVNQLTTFTDGEATVPVPVSSIISGEIPSNVTSADFNIQHGIINSANVISSSASVEELSIIGDIVVLPVTIRGVEYDSVTSTWSSISGDKMLHLFITVV